jgi:hypothetical protein
MPHDISGPGGPDHAAQFFAQWAAQPVADSARQVHLHAVDQHALFESLCTLNGAQLVPRLRGLTPAGLQTLRDCLEGERAALLHRMPATAGARPGFPASLQAEASRAADFAADIQQSRCEELLHWIEAALANPQVGSTALGTADRAIGRLWDFRSAQSDIAKAYAECLQWESALAAVQSDPARAAEQADAQMLLSISRETLQGLILDAESGALDRVCDAAETHFLETVDDHRARLANGLGLGTRLPHEAQALELLDLAVIARGLRDCYAPPNAQTEAEDAAEVGTVRAFGRDLDAEARLSIWHSAYMQALPAVDELRQILNGTPPLRDGIPVQRTASEPGMPQAALVVDVILRPSSLYRSAVETAYGPAPSLSPVWVDREFRRSAAAVDMLPAGSDKVVRSGFASVLSLLRRGEKALAATAEPIMDTVHLVKDLPGHAKEKEALFAVLERIAFVPHQGTDPALHADRHVVAAFAGSVRHYGPLRAAADDGRQNGEGTSIGADEESYRRSLDNVLGPGAQERFFVVQGPLGLALSDDV